MKILFIVIVLFLFSCRYEKEIQAEWAVVELDYMEPLYRQGIEAGCKLTFVDIKTGVPYTLFAHAPEYCDDFLIGVKYKILIRR